MLTRPIPSTGEALPVIGCGTWRAFNVGASPEERLPLHGVLQTLLDAGGTLIDSSPMYGRAEAVVGASIGSLCAQDPAYRDRAFIATKVWCHGREAGLAQMTQSLALLGVARLDLVQIHNLVDWRTHLPTLREWKAQGRVRHIGITHFKAGEQPALEAVMRAEAIDFVQVNYSWPTAPPSAACCRWRRSAASPCWSTGRSAWARWCAAWSAKCCLTSPRRWAAAAGRSSR